MFSVFEAEQKRSPSAHFSSPTMGAAPKQPGINVTSPSRLDPLPNFFEFEFQPSKPSVNSPETIPTAPSIQIVPNLSCVTLQETDEGNYITR